MGHDDASGAYTGAYAVKTLKAQHIVVIDDRTSFGAGLATQFIKGVQSNGGTVMDHEYVDDKTTDFSGVLTDHQGQTRGPGFLRRYRRAGRAARAPHASTADSTRRLLGAGGFVSQTFLKLAGPDGEGVTALEPGRPIALYARRQGVRCAIPRALSCADRIARTVRL